MKKLTKTFMILALMFLNVNTVFAADEDMTVKIEFTLPDGIENKKVFLDKEKPFLYGNEALSLVELQAKGLNELDAVARFVPIESGDHHLLLNNYDGGTIRAVGENFPSLSISMTGNNRITVRETIFNEHDIKWAGGIVGGRNGTAINLSGNASLLIDVDVSEKAYGIVNFYNYNETLVNSTQSIRISELDLTIKVKSQSGFSYGIFSLGQIIINTDKDININSHSVDKPGEGYGLFLHGTAILTKVNNLNITASYMPIQMSKIYIDDITKILLKGTYANSQHFFDYDKVEYDFKSYDEEEYKVIEITKNNTVVTPEEFNVDFLDYDGTILKTEKIEKGKAATAPIDPTREGYDFVGWDKTFDDIQNDLEVKAVYKLIEVLPTYTYEILQGSNSTWRKGDILGNTFIIDGDIALFEGVEVNGVLLEAKYYTVEEGSVIVTLLADYLETLEEGEFNINFIFKDIEVDTKFSILNLNDEDTEEKPEQTPEEKPEEKLEEKPKTPPTGIKENIYTYIGILFISLIYTLKFRKKKYS